MGGIGRAIRDRLQPFGFSKIVYHNRKPLSKELEGGAEYVTKEELFKEADIICISVPLNSHTRHSINKETINQMKDGVILVNTARGAVVDEKVIPELIKSGKIGAFGADVFENEPEVSPELYELPNVVSSHIWVLILLKHVEKWKNGSLKMSNLISRQAKLKPLFRNNKVYFRLHRN